ncbi:MAG TPA: arginine deiminase-related protein [Thermoanaerobaculia bacterium]|nr:arginine deiminase-related protein [Thermoanaerobaculia bacterium]
MKAAREAPIVETPAAFREAVARLDWRPSRPATARGALLVSPVGFRLDEQSASDNLYMATDGEVSEARALEEHRRLAEALAGTLPVMVLPGDPATPDAVFPNNVFATVPGRLIVGRMRHPVRRLEAPRADIRERLGPGLGYETIDLSAREDLVAELTGPLVVDRARGIGYVGLSERCDRAGAEAMHEAFDLALSFVFELAPGEYHTNVVMAVLAGRALVVHEGSFRDPEVPAAIAELYPDRTLRLSDEEKAAFVGNCIALSENEVWMSERAERALRPESRAALGSWGFAVRSVPLEEIEKSGGSLRCCVAEIF